MLFNFGLILLTISMIAFVVFAVIGAAVIINLVFGIDYVLAASIFCFLMIVITGIAFDIIERADTNEESGN